MSTGIFMFATELKTANKAEKYCKNSTPYFSQHDPEPSLHGLTIVELYPYFIDLFVYVHFN